MTTKIFLADLSHTTAQGLTSEFIPYGVGCLKAYLLAHGRHRDACEVRLFQDPDLLIESFLDAPPDILGFSNYSWNRDLGLALAAEAKRRRPELLVTFGGPNYPLEDPLREAWLRRYPQVDLYVTGEGEQPFTELVDRWIELEGDLEALRREGIEGVHVLVNKALFKSSDVTPRLKTMDLFPSPYCEGYLDEFLADPKLIPLTETNRGCPFLCTFCEKGVSSWNKMTMRSPDSFEEEVRYIAERTGSSFLILADNNFGMFKEDVTVARAINRAYKDFGYPAQVYSATGKSRSDRVVEAVTELEGRMPVTVAVQSMDDEVLENIKRKNLPFETLMDVASRRYSVGTRTRSEVILGLPGDSREKHINSLCQLMDAGVSFLLAYTLILLDGSELNMTESRERFDMKSRFRLNHRCFGNYDFDGTRIRAAEIEEVVVGLDTLTHDDYYECRRFYLSVGIFYIDEILFELISFLRQFGRTPSEFVRRVHEQGRKHFTRQLTDLYESFDFATRNELWDSYEELSRFMQAADRGPDDIEEIGGYNVIFRHRARAFCELVEDVVDASFATVREWLPEVASEHDGYLAQLQEYMRLRKRNVFDYRQRFRASFDYDFLAADEEGFATVPTRLAAPIELEFFHDEEQKGLFGTFNPGIDGAARAMAKLQMPRMYRALSYGSLDAVRAAAEETHRDSEVAGQ